MAASFVRGGLWGEGGRPLFRCGILKGAVHSSQGIRLCWWVLISLEADLLRCFFASWSASPGRRGMEIVPSERWFSSKTDSPTWLNAWEARTHLGEVLKSRHIYISMKQESFISSQCDYHFTFQRLHVLGNFFVSFSVNYLRCLKSSMSSLYWTGGTLPETLKKENLHGQNLK